MKRSVNPFNKVASLLVVSTTLVGALESASGAVVYSDGFAFTGSSNSSLGNVGWSGYYGALATEVTTTGTGDRAGSANANGPADPSVASNNKGYLFSANGTTADQTFTLIENTFTSLSADKVT